MDAVGRTSSVIKAVDAAPALKERAGDQFALLLEQQRGALVAILGEAQTTEKLDLTWGALRGVQSQCDAVFKEALAYLQGVLVRASGLDRGLCTVADALLDDLSRRAGVAWNRFTILADSEFFADMAAIVRLRFPELNVWSLPIAAHEFGHFVGPALRLKSAGISRHPFEEILERESRRDARGWRYTHEYFADAFATYALGPAYACTCALLRFDPSTASTDGERHPSEAKRMHLILGILDEMNRSEPLEPFGGVLQVLQEAWAEQIASGGEGAGLDERARAEVDALRDELLALMQQHMPPRLRYSGQRGMRASVIAAAMIGEAELRLVRDDTIAEVVNAAWECRLQAARLSRSDVEPIAKRAFQLSLDIALRGGEPEAVR
jgi:hypothetical protein